MLDVVGFEAVAHEGSDLLVVGGNVEVFVEAFQELQVVLLLPGNACSDCAVLVELHKVRVVEHLLIGFLHSGYFLRSVQPSSIAHTGFLLSSHFSHYRSKIDLPKMKEMARNKVYFVLKEVSFSDEGETLFELTI